MTTQEKVSALRDMAAQILTPSSAGKNLFNEVADDLEKTLGFNVDLLKGEKALTNPNFHTLNVHDGRNDRLLHAVLCAYAKHHLEWEGIGWERLGEILHDVICNEIGDDEYIAWGERITGNDLINQQ